MVISSARDKCNSPHRVCQRCTQYYVPGKDGKDFIQKGVKCHLCAGIRCSQREKLHNEAGVDDTVIKFYNMETASKKARYCALNSPSEKGPANVILKEKYDDHFRVRYDSRVIKDYNDFLQFLKARDKVKLFPAVFDLYFGHTRVQVFFPLIESRIPSCS